MNSIRLKHDSRDFVHSNAFGQAVDIPDEINFDTILPDNIQPLGDVKCVCYSVCDEAEDEFGVEFDILDLWNRIPHNQFGSDPREVLSVVINQDKGGLLSIGGADRRKDYKSFYRADLGQRDAFDNVRVSATIAQTSVIGALYWCAEWLNLPEGSVMPEGKTQMNGHAFTIEGWKQINGEPMFIVEWWGGRKYYMPRSVFNSAMSKWGTQTWILATEEVNNRREKTILEAIKDTLINVVNILKQLLAKKQEVQKVDKPIEPQPTQVYNEVKEAMKKNLLDEFCLAIRDYEGKPGDLNYRNNNPGNIRGTDGKFLKFKTMDEGMAYLKDYVTRACTGKHKAYRPDFTITEFFQVYAPSNDNNNPFKYASWVAGKLGVLTIFKIRDLLT